MNDTYSLRVIDLNYTKDAESFHRILACHDLRYEENIEFAVGIFEDENLMACGAFSENVLKCFAVDEQLRGENLLARLVTALVEEEFSYGRTNLFVFTKPMKSMYFENLGFTLIGLTERVALLENRKTGLSQYISKIKVSQECEEAITGAIVMNCNPFTNGHRMLVEYALSQCNRLYVFVVEEDKSIIPFKTRLALAKDALSNMKNVMVCSGGNYMISFATFPTYFLKEQENANDIYAHLDATIFATKIAPPLNITKRFLGEEQECLVTAGYNLALQSVLPKYGVEVLIIPRATINGSPISASTVRKLATEKNSRELLTEMVPPCTLKYLVNTFNKE